MVLNSNSALSLNKDKLVRLIKEHSSIVWVKTFDKESVYDILDEICSSEGYKSKYVELKKNCEKDILTWSISLGRKVFRASNSDETNDEKLHVTIRKFAQEKPFDVLVLDDISQLLQPTHADSSLIISCLQDFSYNNSKWKKRDKDKGVGSRNDKTILIISPVFDLIDNFQHMVEILEEPIPDEEDIRHELGFDVLESPVDVDSCDVKGLLQLPSNQSTPQITGSIIDYH